jgi:hypothetical protein
MAIHVGKCPKCNGTLNKVRAESIDVHVGALGTGGSYRGVSYFCPMCHAVLSVSIDPLAVKADTVKATVKAIRKGL